MSANQSNLLEERKCLWCKKVLDFGRLHFCNEDCEKSAWDAVEPASMMEIRAIVEESPAFQKILAEDELNGVDFTDVFVGVHSK